MRRLMPQWRCSRSGSPRDGFAQTGNADAVMAAARAALGGDAKIAAVKTFIATGRTRQVRGENLVPIEFEIQAELPTSIRGATSFRRRMPVRSPPVSLATRWC